MFIIRCLILTLVLTCFNGLDARAAGNAATLAAHNISTQELALSPHAYKIAKATFLPDTYDDLGLSGRYNTKYDFNKENCDAYQLSSCPANANCTTCPFNKRKFKLNSCNNGFTLSNNICKASSCQAINASYQSNIPTNKVCTKTTEGGLTCYKDCRAISCSGYSLNCDTFNVANSSGKAVCPDCEKADANCSPKLCKVASCMDGYKIAENGTTCVALDDTCPNGYYKSCETSTVGEPKYTEKGTACYQCKAKEPETCAKYVEQYFPDYTRIGSTADLQHTLIDGKNNFVIVNNFTLDADVDLSGKTVMGANEIAAASPLCANTPKITTEKTIKTNNQSIIKKIHFVNNATNKNSSSTTTALISGGGSFYDLEFSVQNTSASPIVGNTYSSHILTTGTANIYNIKTASSNKTFSVGANGTLNIKGNIVIDNTALTDNGWDGAPLVISGNNTTINIENGSTFNYTGSSDFIRSDVGVSTKPTNTTININGKINWTKTSDKYARHIMFDCIDKATFNFNHENTYQGSLWVYCGTNTANINAKTTINIVEKTASSSAKDTRILDVEGGKININAPLIANGPTSWENIGVYDGMFHSDYTYINSEVTVNSPANLHYAIGEKLELGPNAYIKGIGRIYFHKVTNEEFIIKKGAKLQFSGGTCKKATADKTLTPAYKSDIDWKTPQSPFTGGC